MHSPRTPIPPILSHPINLVRRLCALSPTRRDVQRYDSPIQRTTTPVSAQVTKVGKTFADMDEKSDVLDLVTRMTGWSDKSWNCTHFECLKLQKLLSSLFSPTVSALTHLSANPYIQSTTSFAASEELRALCPNTSGFLRFNWLRMCIVAL